MAIDVVNQLHLTMSIKLVTAFGVISIAKFKNDCWIIFTQKTKNFLA